jgi:hypothetical protein
MVFAADPLAPWGQIAAIILLLYMFISVILGLGLALGLMFGLNWVRQKAELIKLLRPTVDSVNTTTEAAIAGKLPPASPTSDTRDKIARGVAQVPVLAHTVEQKVEQGSDRVANVVIEFRARTEMAKGMLKAFFLPGLTHQPEAVQQQEGVDFRSPGYKMLVDEKVPGDSTAGYDSRSIRPSQIRDEPVTVVTEVPKEVQNIPTAPDRKDAPVR